MNLVEVQRYPVQSFLTNKSVVEMDEVVIDLHLQSRLRGTHIGLWKICRLMTVVGNQVHGDDVKDGDKVPSVELRQLVLRRNQVPKTAKGLIEPVHLW